MLKGKEILLEIINNALLAEQTSSNLQQIDFDTTELKAFLKNYNNPQVDILHLTDGILNNVVKYVEPESEQKVFVATIKYIRGLATINKEKNETTELSTEQLLKLNDLSELINLAIEDNEELASHMKERSAKQISDYRHILKTLQTEEIFTDLDYDIVEEIVKNEVSSEAENILDKVFTFINEFNSRKMEEKITGKKIIQTEITQSNDAEESSDNNLVISNTNSTKETKTNIIKLSVNSLGVNYDLLPIGSKLKLIGIKETDEFGALTTYIIKNSINILMKNNVHGLIYLLLNSSEDILKEVINTLETFKITTDTSAFEKLLNTATSLFSNKNSSNFIKNIKFLSKYARSINDLILNDISIFIVENNILENRVNKLVEFNVDIKDVINNSSKILFTNHKRNLFESNIEILNMYGFDLELFFKHNEAIKLLINYDLASKIDQLIEVGLNDFIHADKSEAGINLKNLIMKRILYANKNNYAVWSNIKEGNYSKIVDESDLVISSKDIDELKNMYPVLNIIDEGYRAAIYTDEEIGLLKRNTEYVFGTQIISRIKVYKVFKILSNLVNNEKELLYYAITYNSFLEPHEQEFISEAVSRIGDSEEYDRLLSGV